ncbi:hypothetical protein [Psychroserpens luteolus]|uniref:hypothetical protein n=1 Tax=Psychroserpens luteolus TaxID=2855840 RepID=UPI001E4E01CC|nr:hypothetical protein [Psychroserpens luteolus]MCD2257721.1 hypothetical protein [Psychroserpens luteolus]
MANTNGNDSDLQNPEKKICEKLKYIKNEKKAADSLYKANDTKRESKESSRGYKICCLNKAEETHNLYQDLMSCIVLKNYTKAGIIQKSVDDYCKKDDDLEKLINESSKLINDLRVKINEANDAACVMVNCVKECIIPKPKRGKGSKGSSVAKEVKDVSRTLGDITDKTSELACKGQNAFNSVVNIAGIQTFTNTGGLKSFATKLMDTMKILNDCITENIKTTEKDVITYRDELNVIVEELAEVSCTMLAEGSKSEGLKNTRIFICEGECKEDDLDILCECADEGDCDDDDHYSGKNKQQSVDKD